MANNYVHYPISFISSTYQYLIDTFQKLTQESKDPTGLDLIPDDVVRHIFSFLSVRDLVHTGATCRKLKILSETPSLWTIFYNRISLWPEKQQSKLGVVEKIKSLITHTRGDPKNALEAHITLSWLELSSLEKAFDCAKTITITEDEQNEHPSSPFHRKSFYDYGYSLAYAYLANNNLSKAEEIMTNMVRSTSRGVIAFEIVKRYLKVDDLEKAFSAMKCINDQLESFPALSLFIWKAKKANNINIALRALKEFSNFGICFSCVKDFNDFLIEKEEFELSQQLQTLYPNAFTENTVFNDVRYYAYNNQIAKAIQCALLLSGTRKKIEALDELTHINDNGTYLKLQALDKKERQEYTSRIATLTENLWKDLWKELSMKKI